MARSSDEKVPQPVRFLNENGELLSDAHPLLTDERIVAAFRLMRLSRKVDDRAISLQRQGRLGTFSPAYGQEASIIGSAFALNPGEDWIVPQYRELAAMIYHGFPLERFFMYFQGKLSGAHVPEPTKVLPLQIALAAQIPHAVGLAWGLRLQGSSAVVLVYFGDGASSEGDFHEACNLAGLLKCPVIFFLQNNGWAISTPRRLQTAAETFADKAQGYGFPGKLVDGNDLIAVHAVTVEAARRARAGEGPTLIESQTYRLGPHNTADDPSRYASAEETDEWRGRDPLIRVQRYLQNRGLWDELRAAEHDEVVTAQIDAALSSADSQATHPDELFEHVYAEMPRRLANQMRAMHQLQAMGEP